jgi:hypothetical protein
MRPANLPIWLFRENEDRTSDMCVLSKLKDNGIIGIGTLELLLSELTVVADDLEFKVGRGVDGLSSS